MEAMRAMEENGGQRGGIRVRGHQWPIQQSSLQTRVPGRVRAQQMLPTHPHLHRCRPVRRAQIPLGNMSHSCLQYPSQVQHGLPRVGCNLYKPHRLLHYLPRVQHGLSRVRYKILKPHRLLQSLPRFQHGLPRVGCKLYKPHRLLHYLPRVQHGLSRVRYKILKPHRLLQSLPRFQHGLPRVGG